MNPSKQFYKDKLRVRVCGLCFQGDSILLVKHNLDGSDFYAPPGGAVQFGETMEEALVREFLEETKIEINSCTFKFVTEYIHPPLHAIEMFYTVDQREGKAQVGSDPESKEISIIQDVKFYSPNELQKLKSSELHHVLHNCTNPKKLLDLTGYIQPPKKYNN